MKNGKVYLVGAGPGDPGLLTLKGKRVLETADTVVFDRLVGAQILSFAPPHAERMYVGKASSDHSLPQEKINELLARKCAEGKSVVRLKGGDPLLFGRGGEEALYLAARGCPFEIVPGVTSAIAAPAYAGIPVTHRDAAASVAFITGHEKPGKAGSSIRWRELAAGADTLVFLMGVENLPSIAENLIAAGRPADTPAALVRRGSLPDQAVLTATLETIVRKAREQGIAPPAVLVVGDVVLLRERLAWAEKLPLWGRRIVVTRPAAQAADFIERLQSLGASVVAFPTVEIRKEPDLSKLHEALDNMGAYRWLIVTSRNGADIFCDELFGRGMDMRRLQGVAVGAIGPATAECLRGRGLVADAVPLDYRAEGLLEILREKVRPGDAVLLPRAAGSRDVLPEGLSALGARVDEVVTYRSSPPESADPAALEALQAGAADLITFTSSSTVEGFAALVGRECLAGIAARCPAACIGPVTAETARRHGFTIAAQAPEYTTQGLLSEILAYCADTRGCDC